MTKIFAVLIALLSTTISLAGTPDEDPVVRERRERFIQGRTPTLEDLKLGKTWQCIGYSAIPGDFKVVGPRDAFRFSEFDGMIFSAVKTPYQTHQFFLDSRNFTDIVTTRRPDNNYEKVSSVFYIRVSSNGDLILENTFDESVFPLLDGSPRSILDKTKFAAQYGVCPINKIRD
ncbi:MAG: hypothetical protein ABIQ95_04560 [Bdellovibrionia bacterium]